MNKLSEVLLFLVLFAFIIDLGIEGILLLAFAEEPNIPLLILSIILYTLYIVWGIVKLIKIIMRKRDIFEEDELLG